MRMKYANRSASLITYYHIAAQIYLD